MGAALDPFAPLLAGLGAGAIHVLSGPDHLAAVLPLAVERRRRGAVIGAAWGLGHGAGVLALGALGQLLKDRIDIEAVSSISELVVGLLLVALGGWAIWRSRLVVVHAHGHAHDEPGHTHPHVHLGDETVGHADHAESGSHAGHHHSAFGFGLLHGTAGAGHLFGVLPSLVLGPAAAALYLGAYVGSAVLAMTLFAGGISRLSSRLGALPSLMRGAGLVTLGIGFYWVATAA